MKKVPTNLGGTVIGILLIMTISALGKAQVPVQKKIPIPKIAIVDVPEIEEFTISPAVIIKGSSGEVRWKVASKTGASPITGISISRVNGSGPVLNLRSSDLIGQHNLPVPVTTPEGTSIYALTAINELYQVSVAIASVRVTGPPDLTIDNIQSSGASVAFSIKNAGSGDFRGRLILRVSVNDSPGEIRIDRFTRIAKIAEGVYEARDMAITSGNTETFGLLNPETNEPGWYSGTYRISVRVEPDNPSDRPANNEKRITLNHTGLRRGRPELDLYFTEDPSIINYDALADAQVVGVKFKVMNTGPVTATNINWEARIFEGEQLLRGESGWRLKSGTIASLAPGNKEVTFDFYKPDLAGRAILLRIIIDPEDKIFETDETNNSKGIGITIPDRIFE